MTRTKQRVAHPDTRRHVAGGELIGSTEPDGTHAWRGIGYAAAPTGPLRWRAPQPAPPWPGVHEALAHGPMAPQFAGLLAPVPAKLYGQIIGNEDCLHLNVFAPPWAPGAVPAGRERRPVMVWIHGGGNAVGTSASYDVVHNYAARDGLVVVTVNYRLGVLGWFCHPALHEADQATPEERSGNFGTLDLIAALRWVRDSIAAFGGDPGCVTIFGESAGGQNVLTLLASPLAAGLFHRAIAQSPVAETFSAQEATELNTSPLESHRTSSREVVARLWAAHGRAAEVRAAAAASGRTGAPDGAPDGPPESAPETAAWLRSLTPEQLLGVFHPGSVGIYLCPRPVRDGVVLPERPLTEVFRSGAWNRVPVILGSNRDEYRTFLADKPEHAHMLFGKLPLLHNRGDYIAESGYLSQAWRSIHVEAPADALLAGGHGDVWTYRFDWDEAPAIPFVRPDILLGAAHGMEMPFAFRDSAGEFDIFKVNTPFNRPGRQALAQAMGDAWTSFARDGVPLLPGGAAWSRRTLGPAPDTLLLDSPAGGGSRMAAIRQDIGALKQALRDSDTVTSGSTRCRIYARVFLWAPLFVGHGSEAEYAEWCQRFACREAASAFRPAVEV